MAAMLYERLAPKWAVVNLRPHERVEILLKLLGQVELPEVAVERWRGSDDRVPRQGQWATVQTSLSGNYYFESGGCSASSVIVRINSKSRRMTTGSPLSRSTRTSAWISTKAPLKVGFDLSSLIKSRFVAALSRTTFGTLTTSHTDANGREDDRPKIQKWPMNH